MYPRNAATPPTIAVGAVILIADGTVQPSGVSVVVRPEGGAETAGGGTVSYGGSSNVVYYAPTQAETNYTAFTVTAYKTGCIPVSQTVITTASSTAGNAGLDWGSMINKTTTNALTNTSIASVSGAVGSVTGAVGSVTGSVGSISGVTFPTNFSVMAIDSSGRFDLGKWLGTAPLALSSQQVQSVVPSSTVVASVTGNVGGNLVGNVNGNVVGSTASVVGAVGSVTGSVGSVTGSIGGNVSGDLSGNVQGKVLGGGVGTITGDGVRASSVSGAVGSVTGSVGSVTGSVGSVAGSVAGDVAGKVLGGGASSISGAGVRADSVTGSVGSVVGAVGSVSSYGTLVSDIVTASLTTQMTESYAADGTAPTLAQAIFLVQQSLHEFSISGTTRTVKKLDGSTTAAVFTLDDASTPTSTTRSA